MSTLLTVASQAFTEGGDIPREHTCEGRDFSPPVAVSGLPPETVTWALLVDDPDAPGGDWVHWLVFNLPMSLEELAPGISPKALEGLGGSLGANSWGEARYQGPCPPSGTHRYVFKVFALDTVLDLPAGSGKAAFLAAAKGHALGHGMLTGRYARRG